MSNKQDRIYIGSVWKKTGANGEYMSASFVGGREQDEHEVVLINKKDGSQISLSDGVWVNINSVREKTKENSPDFSISITPKE